MTKPRITEKTAVMLAAIERHPGINTAELHRIAGKAYAHGHHRYTYETVARAHRNGLITYGRPVSGRGAGLYVVR